MGFNTALIVDDSKLARVALKRKLEQRGLEIVMAEDARQALELLQSNAIDIVFMDHLMPEMDGFQATREIKGNSATAHLPVIMCSGKEKQGYLEEARAIGASNVLPKPAETNAIDAVFAELEQAEAGSGSAAMVDAGAAPAEAEVLELIQPIANRMEAMVEQFDALAKYTDERFVTVADTVQALSEQGNPAPAVEVEKLQAAWEAQLEQRISGLALPDVDALGAQLETSLQGSLESRLQSDTAEVVAALEQLEAQVWQKGDQLSVRLEQFMGEVEERFKQLDALSAQRGDAIAGVAQDTAALRSEMEQRFSDLGGAAAMPQLDLDGLHASLKAELIEELKELPGPGHNVDTATPDENLKLEILEQIRAELPAAPPQPQLDVDALRESLRADLLEQLGTADQAEAKAAVDIAALQQAVSADVLQRLQENNAFTLEANDTDADGQVSAANAESGASEATPGDHEAIDSALAAQALKFKHELNAAKMLGLISALVAAASIALHWL